MKIDDITRIVTNYISDGTYEKESLEAKIKKAEDRVVKIGKPTTQHAKN